MKKSLLIVLCLSLSYYLMAQDKAKQKEIGLVFSNLDNFGLTYKTGTEKSLWRFTTLVISGRNIKEESDIYIQTQNSLGFGVRIGKEYRKAIVNRLEVRYGADVSFSYNKDKFDHEFKIIDGFNRYTEEINYSPGINFVIGFNYKLSENFVIGAELLPGFAYRFGTMTEKQSNINIEEENKSDISGFNYRLSNSSALLSLVYRFSK